MTTQTAPTSGPMTDEDKAQVAGLPQRIVEAWARYDADAFAAVFTDEGTMILPGVFQKGRESIRAFTRSAFAGPYKGTRVVGTPIDVRFLSAECALLITRGGICVAGETEPAPERAVHASWLAVKQSDGWRLAAYQNSPLHTV